MIDKNMCFRIKKYVADNSVKFERISFIMFTWRLQHVIDRMRNVSYLTHSRTHAADFHYQTYGEISPSNTLVYMLYSSVWFLPFQLDNSARKYILHRWVLRVELLSALVTTSSTCHHIKPSSKGSSLMWWRVLRSAHLAFPTMPYASSLTQIK